MTERLDALVARQYTDRNGEKKTAYTRIGTAWATRNGGWSISLEALPLPQQGENGLETRILLMPPRQDKAPANTHPSQYQSQVSSPVDLDLEDGVPF